MATGVGQG